MSSFTDPQAVAHYAARTRRLVPGLDDLHRMTELLLAERVPGRLPERLEYRIYVLGRSRLPVPTVLYPSIKRRYELNCLAQQLTENAALKAEVEARRTEL